MTIRGLYYKTFYDRNSCCNSIRGLYYQSTTIVNDDSRVVNKLEARVIIYDWHMFILQSTACYFVNSTRNTNWRGRLSTMDLLIKVACFVTKVNNIFNIKAADLN